MGGGGARGRSGFGRSLAAGRLIPTRVRRAARSPTTPHAPPFVGAIPLAIARERVDAIVTVSEEEIRDAMRMLVSARRLYVEARGGGPPPRC